MDLSNYLFVQYSFEIFITYWLLNFKLIQHLTILGYKTRYLKDLLIFFVNSYCFCGNPG
jgi:hypothetical protein